MRALRRLRFVSFVIAALAAGCSLVNSLDDVKQPDDGTFTSAPRPDAATTETFVDSSTSVIVQEASVDTGTQPTGTAFTALVVGGEATTDAGKLEQVLTVLDSKSGREVTKREKMWVAAIAHDAPRDLWYIFEAPKYFIAGPAELVKLHIRKLDNTTGVWTELSTLDLAPIVFYDSIAITNERISYAAHPSPGTSQFRLVTVETGNPASPVVNSYLPLAQLPRGMVATRSATGPGGIVNLYNNGTNPVVVPSDAGADAGDDSGAPTPPPTTPECQNEGGALGNVCVARVRQYLIPNSGQPTNFATHTYGRMAQNGQPAVASIICGGGPDDVTALPLADGNHGIYTRAFGQGSTTAAPIPFKMSTIVTAPTSLRRAAVDNSRRLVFVVESNADTDLHIVSLNPAIPEAKVPLQRSGQSVYYDPGSDTVFAPFNQGGGSSFGAFRVRGTSTAFTVTPRTPVTEDAPWNPPADLRPLLLGIKYPVPGTEVCGL